MVFKVEDLDIYQMAEDLSDRIWGICIKSDLENNYQNIDITY